MKIVYITLLFLFCGFILTNDKAHAQDFNAIRGVYISEENTNSDPEMDSAGVNVLFRDSTGNSISPINGTEFQYKCVVYEYDNKQQGEKIGEGKGKVTSDGSNTFFIVNLVNIASKKRIIAHVQITTPTGKILQGKGSTIFDPENY